MFFIVVDIHLISLFLAKFHPKMSVSWGAGTQYSKLKTHLRLAANRLKLLQKKKTEQAMKARTEIAEFLLGKLLFVFAAINNIYV